VEYIQLGRSGLWVSRFVFGTFTFSKTSGFAAGAAAGDEARRQIDIAIEAGVNTFDTANVYSNGESESILGEALEGRRDKAVVCTKAGFPLGDPNQGGSSRIHLTTQIEKSLKRLKTDYVDLYFIHLWDGLTPVEETVETMSDLVKAGKIRYWGVSNYSGWSLAKTVMTARASGFIQPICQQIYYTPEAREAEYELLPAGQDLGV
jgi:aryl-alcohol dehydrogenase-like predicted oxidoreductase